MATIGLVSCSALKLARPAPARELYRSPLFRLALAYAEARCEHVYVLSAAHDLVRLDQWLERYDRRLEGKKERTAWGRRVASTLIRLHGREVDYMILAGADYANPLAGALRTHDGYQEDGWHGVASARIRLPLAGPQIGERLRWLNRELRAGSRTPAAGR